MGTDSRPLVHVGDEACRLLDWGGKVPEHAAPVDQSMGGTR